MLSYQYFKKIIEMYLLFISINIGITSEKRKAQYKITLKSAQWLAPLSRTHVNPLF